MISHGENQTPISTTDLTAGVFLIVDDLIATFSQMCVEEVH